MTYSNKLQKAIKFAIKVHQGQTRKGKKEAYIVHPLAVGLILARVTNDEDIIIAGILHDTIEDCKPYGSITKKLIVKEFGKNVAEMVNDVTEQDKSLPWEERKRLALEHMKIIKRDSLLIKSADITSNGNELLSDYKDDGERVFDRFNASKEELLKNYLEVTLVMLVDCWSDNPFANDLKEIADSIAKIVRNMDKPAPRLGNSTITDQKLIDRMQRLFWVDAIIQLEVQIKNRNVSGVWRLEGWDTFSMESYPLDGAYANEEEAREAAKLGLAELEKTQPSTTSGGQSGIQDQIFLIAPDGSRYRFRV